MFSKIGRWVAGRTQGSKGVQKYDSWMQKNPWAGAALDIGGGLALGAGMPALLGKFGATKGIAAALKGSKLAQTGLRMAGSKLGGGSDGIMMNATGGDTMPGDGTGPMDYEQSDLAREKQAEAEYGAQDAAYADAIGRAGAFNPSETAGMNFDDISGFRAGATEGVSTDGLANWQAQNLGGVDLSGVSDFQSQNLAGFDPNAAKNFSMGELEGWNADKLEGFDPSSALKEWATGAFGQAKVGLDEKLRDLRDSAVRGGRLNTGFFDKDTGSVTQRVMGDFSDSLAQQALGAAGIRADVLGKGAQLRLSQATDLAGNRRQAAATAADLGFRKASGMDANALEAKSTGAKLALDRAGQVDNLLAQNLRSATGYNLDRAKTIDTLGLDARTQAGRLALDRAKSVDDGRQRAAEFSATEQGKRAGRTADRSMSYGDRARDWAAGAADRRQGAANARAEQRNNRTQNLINGGRVLVDAWRTFRPGKRT